MSAKSDTQQRAKATADQLLKEGIRPTQQNVRERMGSGSITTINKALNSWWQELGERMKANTSHPMIPDPVAESAAKLWHQALAYAENTLTERRATLEAEFRKKTKEATSVSSEDKRELKELRAQCLRLLQDNERIAAERNSLQHKHLKLENELMESQAACSNLTRQLKQAEIVTQGSGNLDQYIEIQVTNRTLKEENKRLNKQIDTLIKEKSDLLIRLARAESAEN